MEQELEKYYENRLSMMAEPAWNDLMEDIDSMAKAINDISSIKDEKTLHYRRGELSMIEWMRNLKSISELTYQQLKEH